MDEIRKVIRIILASPGDLKDERVAAKSAIDELNQSWLAHFGYHAELVGWELTVAAVGRPQALINRDLDACEYFIGVLWKRWGTPPAKEGRYQSGFEEEYERSLKRHECTEKPEISLLFKTIDATEQQDPGPQLRNVLEFKKKIIDDHRLLFEEFDSVSDFEARIRRCVCDYVLRLVGRENAASSAAFDATSREASTAVIAPEQSSQQESPLSQEGMEFLRKFVSNMNSPTGAAFLPPVDIARFRLLGTLLVVDADDPLLAIHDANRLFAARKDLTLGTRERIALLDAALSQYEHENVPLWHWLNTIGTPSQLYWRSLVGHSEPARIGALSAMRDIGSGIPTDSDHPRSMYIGFWFDEEAPAPRRAAAIRYLADFGVWDDIAFIKKELEQKNYQTTAAATDAIIRISLRYGRTKAFAALIELQPDTLDDRLIALLFASTAGVHDKELEACISHKNSSVRLASARELVRRNSLRIELAERLLGDSSVDIRLEAIKQLTREGHRFSRAEIEKHLLLREHGGRGLLWFGASQVNDEKLKDFKFWQRSSASDRELEEGGSLYDRDSEFLLDERHFSTRGDAVRAAVSNEYKDKFEHAIAELESKVGSDRTLIEETRKLERFVRQRHTRGGLNVICRKGSASDLVLVREAIDRGHVDYSNDDIMFLQRFGEWEDIPRIVDLANRNASSELGSSSLLGLTISLHPDNKYSNAAKAIYSIGRERVDEIFTITMPDQILRHLIMEMPDKGFTMLQDATILGFFRSKEASVRKAAALKSVRSLNRTRQNNLLSGYLAESYRYYNVILWLDLGVSMPREIARAAAQRILSRTHR